MSIFFCYRCFPEAENKSVRLLAPEAYHGIYWCLPNWQVPHRVFDCVQNLQLDAQISETLDLQHAGNTNLLQSSLSLPDKMIWFSLLPPHLKARFDIAAGFVALRSESLLRIEGLRIRQDSLHDVLSPPSHLIGQVKASSTQSPSTLATGQMYGRTCSESDPPAMMTTEA